MKNSPKTNQYGIYVHIPFCKARCGYCAFSTCVDFALCQSYFDALTAEIARANVGDTQITTMFWGGGTPSSVPTPYLQKLWQALAAKVDLSHLTEFTVECNPESTTEELIKTLVSFGVNRISFGLQSANDQTLRAIGRLHNYEQFLQALDIARACGIKNVNADLILGLPESQEDFLHSVEVVSKLNLQHLSLYALEIHEKNVAFKRLCDQCAHSDDDLANMYDSAKQIFEREGFCRYEVSNFAKDGYECKHNLLYWTENRYFGFGAAASSFINNVRSNNIFDIKKYLQYPQCKEYVEIISPREEMVEYVMLGLRLQNGFSLQDFAERYKADFYLEFPVAHKLAREGFLAECDGRVFVPDNKFYVLNSILTELLPD